MNPFDHCVSARASPGSDALYSLNTVKSVQGPLHRRPGVVLNKQGFPHYGRMRVKKLVHETNETNIRIGSWNIGTLNGKLMELVDIMIHRKINILCIQETKWVGEKAKEIDNLGFKLWYSGKSRTRNGVGVIIDKSLKDNVVNINRVGDRIIALKIIIDTKIFNIISVYAPQVGLDTGSKDKFWNDLEDLIQMIPLEERIFIGGDLNGHVGRVVEDFRNIHGGYGFGVTNEEGRAILDFALAYDFVITNTLFKKRDEHLITYKSGSNKTQIDYFLMRRRDRRDCKDCKVIPSDNLNTQHRLLVLDFKIKSCKIKNTRTHHCRIRWRNLKDTNKIIFMSKIQDFKIWDIHEEANVMWDKVTNTIKQVAKNVLGESKEKIFTNKNSWWWNNNVQEKIKYKKLCYKNWFKCKSLENWKKYQTARRESKRTIGDAKNTAFNDLYNRLDTKEGEKYMYKLAKQREKKSKDLTQVKCIKDENQKVLFLEKDIQHRWVSYFDKLFNEVSENSIDLSDFNIVNNNKTYHFYRRISKKEVEEALKKTKGGKSVGPDDIPIEVWKYLGDLGVSWLTKLFNIILKTKKMPEEWRKSILVPIFKNKGDAQECANYRGIKLMCHTLKLWERVIEHRLRRITKISHNQFGFMPGRSTMEAIHLLRGLMEKFRDNKENLHLIFIDLEKAYDKVPRDILWRVLEKKCVDMTYIQVIKDMYTRVVTCVQTEGGLTKYFPISVGLHQGSALSPYLFALVMDGLTGHLQEDVPWCMLFADDILLVDKTREKAQEKLELWRSTLESKGLRLSRTKTEYMECNFSSNSSSDRSVILGDQIIKRCERFRYLGSVVQSDGDIDGDVNSRIQVGWLKWRNASGLLCDRKVPLRLKGKFYKTVVRPAMLYGAECWPLKEKHNNKLSVAEMRMIRWMSGFTLRDKMRNEYIRDRVGVAPVTDKIRESRLRWFGHIKRRPLDDPIRRVDVLDSTCVKKGRGRPRKTWAYCIKNDLNLLELNENMTLNRTQWRKRIHVADPT